MKIVVWNYRGLGTPQAIPELPLLVRQHSLDVMFLCERKLTRHEMERVKEKVWLSCGMAVDSIDRRGGLALLWKDDTQVTLSSYNDRMIDVKMNERDDRPSWWFTGFYGHPFVADRSVSWQLLKSLHENDDEAWLVGDDFNEILQGHEKKGGPPR